MEYYDSQGRQLIVISRHDDDDRSWFALKNHQGAIWSTTYAVGQIIDVERKDIFDLVGESKTKIVDEWDLALEVTSLKNEFRKLYSTINNNLNSSN